ncbi:transposase, partial [Nitrosomonas supralitoralis]|uniref:transposase n=1 Tax=Nitrosomonas supralitoralis TaxID=2116706 RepID=UPI001F5B3D27
MIVKHKLLISDEETVAQIRENPYLQYFIGLKGFKRRRPLHHHYWLRYASAWVRRCLMNFMRQPSRRLNLKRQRKSVKAIDDDNNDNNVSNSSDATTSLEADQSLVDELPLNHSQLILDAIVAELAIRYPTDLGLLHAQRSFIDYI